MLFALHEVLGLHSHIVAQIVETELIVRTEGDIAGVSLAAIFGVRLGLVDTSHCESMELIEGPHPLGVTLGEVIIDRNDMDTLSGEGVEEHRESSHEGLTLTGGHLGDVVGDLAIVGDAMEHHTTDELHVIVHHIPGDQVATCHPGVLVDSLIAIDGDKIFTLTSQLAVSLSGSHFDGFILLETTSRLLDHGKHFGEHAVEVFGVIVEHLFAEIVDLLP